MDLDDMKQAWRQLDARVSRLERARAVDTTRGAVRGAIAAERAKLVVWLLFVAFAAPQLAAVPIAAGAIVAWSVAAFVLGVRQLRASHRIDYAAPVAHLQHALLALDRLRATCSLALGLPWWLLWIAFPLVLAAWGGVDLYAHARAAVLANIAVGAAGLVGSLAIARALAKRASTSRLVAALTGTRIKRAAAALGDVAAFARGE